MSGWGSGVAGVGGGARVRGTSGSVGLGYGQRFFFPQFSDIFFYFPFFILINHTTVIHVLLSFSFQVETT